MTRTPKAQTSTIVVGLRATNAQLRLRAALASGTSPDPEFVAALIERSAVEPDFFVRDMLTWALTRHDPNDVVPLLIGELRSSPPQARSQALHTLSKIGDSSMWGSVPSSLLTDRDDEVARAAWRAAVALAPESSEVAAILVTQLGRGNDELQRSLSRAFVGIGHDSLNLILRAQSSDDPDVRAHAVATEALMRDPDTGFADSLHEARRTVALKGR
ncbi:HEAT repeat domain-containing protein [Gordonia sp. (in: high G+C Gram-positive bacteria)]|uniref:HEAT repeat domain-containing protein n=1 Tax=Gordonia sp. (in: high G+C Gram-positive bacteria) TaxID=84139 RepID=UPI003C7247BC